MIQLIIPTIIQQFNQLPGVAAVLLFGSYAEGIQRADSDIDIAVLYEHQSIPSALELVELNEKLSDALRSEVDLICLNCADPIIANQIYTHYKPILVKNPQALQEYFMVLSSEYAELKEFIKPMEERILERKYYDSK